jgi:hypothetical protein
MKNLVIIILISALFVGCMSNDTSNSDTVKQTEIYQKYTVSYDEPAKELAITAQFRFGGNGGTTLQLVDPAYIYYNGKEMSLSNNFIKGTFYKVTEQLDFESNHIWEYQDCDKKKFLNGIRIFNGNIDDIYSEISKTNSMSVKWDGSPVQENERISILIETNEGSHYETISTSVKGAKEIVIGPDDLKELPLGAATFQLKREIDMPLNEGEHLGGEIDGEFLSKKVAVNIVE